MSVYLEVSGVLVLRQYLAESLVRYLLWIGVWVRYFAMKNLPP